MNSICPLKKCFITNTKIALIAFSALLVLSIALPAIAYDQPWNGNREDITGPCRTNCKPPPPPCKSGNCKCPPNGTTSPVYAADGSLVWVDTDDISFPVTRRVGLKRTYNSFDYRAGLFGRGWVTAQEVNIARTYRAVTEGNADGSPKTATEFESVPIWLASYGRRYELQETATECATPDVLYFTFRKQDDGTFKQVFEDTKSFSIYSDTGVLLQEYSDEDGTTVYYEYDDQNRLIRQFDSYGFTLNFAYNDQGFVAQVTDQADRAWRYTYDELGRLTQVLDPDGNTKDYGYQAIDNIGFQEHLLTEVNDNSNDLALRVTWNEIAIGTITRPRVTSYTESDGHRHDYSYTSTTFNGQPAVRVVKDTKQINSNSTIERQTFTADLDTYQIVQDINNTNSTTQNSTFDERGNLLTETDKRGNLTRYEYNDAGRIMNKIELAGTTREKITTYTYWNNTNRVATMNEYGILETRYTYDNDLRVLTETQIDLSDNQQRVTTYTYHPNTMDSQGNTVLGKVASVDGPHPGIQDTKTYQYNALGLVTRVNHPLNQSMIYTYNAVGQKLTDVDVNGVTTEMTYNSRNHLISKVRNGRNESFSYNAQDQMTSMVDALGRRTSFEYNSQNQPSRITYPSGDYANFLYQYFPSYTQITRQYYGSDGSLVEAEVIRNDPESNLEINEYLEAISKPVTQSQYNGFDDLVQKTIFGQFENSTSSTETYSYDNEGRLIQITDGLNGITQITYDDFDRMTQVSDANNGLTNYKFNAWGELLSTASPDSGLTTNQIDTSGNVISQNRANGFRTEYRYDSLNRVIRIDYDGDAFDVSFNYDEGQYGIGQLTGVVDGSGNSTFQYDDRGLIIQSSSSVSGVNLSASYNYSDAEELTSITYPSGIVVSNNYDTFGRISGIQLTDENININLVENIIWHGSHVSSFEYLNGIVTNLSYDSAGRLIAKDYGSNHATVYQLDNQENILGQSWNINGQENNSNFQYDFLGRLTRDGDFGDSLDWVYTYDAIGNRLSKQKSDASRITEYTYENNSNRLLTIGARSIELDASGNMLGNGVNQYEYNPLNRLSRAVNNQNSIEAQYTYNYLDQRVRKQISGSNSADVYYYYGTKGELLGEYDSRGRRIREYVYKDLEDKLELTAQIEADGSIVYVHNDHLATPRFATDSTGTIVWSWIGDGFGSNLANEDPDANGLITTINHRFPGQYFDEETLINYNWYRYFDPEIGRYLTSDPVGLFGGFNTYVYVDSNPLTRVDEAGLFWQIPVVLCIRFKSACKAGLKCIKNPSKCRKKVCNKLNTGMHAVCDTVRSCKGNDSCFKIRAKQAQLSACLGLRHSVRICHGKKNDPNRKGHKQAINDVKNRLKKCRKDAKRNCC